MSTSYSANQYESAFRSQKLQNWTIPKHFKETISSRRLHYIYSHRPWPSSTWQEKAWKCMASIPRHMGYTSPNSPASINPTARSQEGQDRLRTWGKIKFATNQAHEVPGSNQALNGSPHNVESINVEQPAEESKVPVSDPDQNEPERPKSKNSQDQSRPTSQQAQSQSNPLILHENQVQSRSGSHHSQQAPSRPATQESQAELRPPTQNSRPASQQK